MTDIIATSRGIETKLEVPDQPLTCLVMPQEINVEVPGVREINSETTIQCMKEMSQEAWEHISTGELFQHLFFTLFGKDAYLPKTIAELNKESRGVVHGSGLIIELVEVRFAKLKKVFVREPETFMHPQQCSNLMMVIKLIQDLK